MNAKLSPPKPIRSAYPPPPTKDRLDILEERFKRSFAAKLRSLANVKPRRRGWIA